MVNICTSFVRFRICVYMHVSCTYVIGVFSNVWVSE